MDRIIKYFTYRMLHLLIMTNKLLSSNSKMRLSFTTWLFLILQLIDDFTPLFHSKIPFMLINIPTNNMMKEVSDADIELNVRCAS